jgi:hypothetical protein
MYENRIMKQIKNYLKKSDEERKSSRRGKFDQSPLYACTEISP